MFWETCREITVKKGGEVYHAHYHSEANEMTVTSGFWRKHIAIDGADELALAKDTLNQMINDGHAQVLRHH